jgi:CLN3 protein
MTFRFLTALSLIARFINAIFLIRVQHVNRIFANTSLMLFSFLLLAFSLSEFDKLSGFYYCIAASLLIGFSQAFGEATLMGYLKAFPSDLVMTFGSGTGLSGFIDIFTVLFLQAMGVSKGRVTYQINCSRHSSCWVCA